MKSIGNQIFWQTLFTLRAQFRGTRGGLLWVALRPMVLIAVYHWVFVSVLKVGKPRYPVFLLVGIVPWVFLSSTLIQLSGGLYKHRGIFFSFPSQTLPAFLADTLAQYSHLLLTFGIVGVPVFVYYDVGLEHLLWVPLTTLPLVGVAFGGGVLLALCQPRFKDIRFLLPTLLQTCFLLTPIVYPVSLVPAEFSWTIYCNPLFLLLSPIQHHLGGAPGLASPLLGSYLVAAITVLVSLLAWQKFRGKVALFV